MGLFIPFKHTTKFFPIGLVGITKKFAVPYVLHLHRVAGRMIMAQHNNWQFLTNLVPIIRGQCFTGALVNSCGKLFFQVIHSFQ